MKKVDNDFPIKIHNKAKKLIKKYMGNTSISNKILSTLGVTLIQPKQEPFFFVKEYKPNFAFKQYEVHTGQRTLIKIITLQIVALTSY